MTASAGESPCAELAEGVRALVSAEFDSVALHRFIDAPGWRVPALQSAARELGCFSLNLPERHDGLGVGVADMVAAYAVLGAYMPPLPLVSTALAVDLLDAAGAEPWLERIAAGAMAAVVLPPVDTLPTLTSGAGGWRCDGEIGFVLDGVDTEILLFKARAPDGDVWVACASGAPGVRLRPTPLIDETRNAAHVTLSKVALAPENVVAAGDACTRSDIGLIEHAALALAADSIGGAGAILEKTLDYLKVREQFSRPIGSFQALKHRAADLHLRLVASRSLLEEAVAAREATAEDAHSLALLACAHACDAYAFIAQDALQLHGGIGFTREHDAHIHLKRAKLNQALLGGSDRLCDLAAGL